MEVTAEQFDDLVAAALDGLPRPLASLMRNVVVLVEPEPPEDEPDLLGRYDGVPLTSRDSGYTFVPPDRILLFRGPLARMCSDLDELAAEVRITTIHEVAHHFGIDDEQLQEWGWG
ncbi:MAG: metallopeptidase family protein [Marmoricola sp.]